VHEEAWETWELRDGYDYLAPDRSEIRLLLGFARGGLAHCTLPAGATSSPVAHKSVDEVWYFLVGVGQVWRKRGDVEEVTDVAAGRCLTIPRRTTFQFRNIGEQPLQILISTMPSWPGPEEAEHVEGHWPD
jgi:mannose-6-phosphate isomerase-like protein (cupin superfamily)